MKPLVRDELLARLDERTSNIWCVVEDIKTHTIEQNGFIMESITLSKSNKTWITVFKWIGGTVILSGLSFAAWVAERFINGG